MKTFIKILFWSCIIALIVSVLGVFVLLANKGGNGIINVSDYTSAFLGPIFSCIAGISLIFIIVLSILKRKVK